MTSRNQTDPYLRCPKYESDNFRLRLVSIDDAEALLECYKNPAVGVRGNADHCTYGYGAQTLEEMREFIRLWLDEYASRSFIRFCILDKRSGDMAGTIEIFGSGPEGRSVLRIDVTSMYENKESLFELISLADVFFTDIGCGQIVSRALPEAAERIAALTRGGYAPYPETEEWSRTHYYIKRNPRPGA